MNSLPTHKVNWSLKAPVYLQTIIIIRRISQKGETNKEKSKGVEQWKK